MKERDRQASLDARHEQGEASEADVRAADTAGRSEEGGQGIGRGAQEQAEAAKRVKDKIESVTRYLRRSRASFDEGAHGGAEWVIHEVRAALDGVRYAHSPLKPRVKP